MAQIPETVTKPTTQSNQKGSGRQYILPFILVTSLFFLWGIAHNLDSILIPHLKKACRLNNRQSTLIDTSVFFAYFIMAIPAGMLLKKWGYKSGIIAGLLLFALGAFLFVPAANSLNFGVFLAALFIIGCGLTILETAANPYAAILGHPDGANFRLNLAASFNGLAAFIAPFIGAAFILSGVEHTNEQLAAMQEADRVTYLAGEAAAVKTPYMVLGGILLLIAGLFFFMKLPEMKDDSKLVRPKDFGRAFRYKHLTWAVVAQFFYVGAQVCVTSFFIRMAKQGGGLEEIAAAKALGIYGLLFMIGRFVGTFLLKFFPAARLLAIYSLISVALSLIAIYGDGKYVVYALSALGFFMSIMFPTIFGLGIQGLGSDTKIGASLLVMSIVGGAIFPYVMGTIIDINNDDIQVGYYIPAVCYIVILYFALSGYKIKTLEEL
jgi:MFS transporter, FHS family, L-fucose permease